MKKHLFIQGIVLLDQKVMCIVLHSPLGCYSNLMLYPAENSAHSADPWNLHERL